jgi:hypothetical protein
MLTEIRRFDLLSKTFFYQYRHFKGNAIRSAGTGGIFLYFLGFMTLGGGMPLWLLLIPLFFFALPAVSMVHPLYRARRCESWRDTWDLRYEGQYFRCLPSEDKALYPYNILKTITDPDLDDAQAKQLDKEMTKLRISIEDRNKQRRLAVKKHLDIADLLESMKEAQASVQIETDTYKELM